MCQYELVEAGEILKSIESLKIASFNTSDCFD